MPFAAKDFHSDGWSMNGDVNIVNAYGFLGSDVETLLLEERYKKSLSRSRRRGPFVIQGSGYQSAARGIRATSGGMGSDSKVTSFFGRESGHSDSVSLGLISRDDPSFEESLAEG